MTQAAHKLFLTQPAVSQQIRLLEENLGVDLLVRGVREVTPTAQGQLLNDYAIKVINLVGEAKLAIQAMGEGVIGPVRIGTLNSIGLHLIGPVLSLFLKNNSKVRMHLEYGVGPDLVEQLEKNELDIVILPDLKKEYGIETEQLESHELFEDEMWLVSAMKDKNITSKIELEQLSHYPFIQLKDEYPNFQYLLNRDLKAKGVNLKPVFDSANVGSLKRVIEAGLGWGFLPSHAIKKQVLSRRVDKIEVENFSYKIKMNCYLASKNKKSKATEVFLNAVKQPKI